MFDTNVFVVKEVENKNHRNSKMFSQECVTFKKKYKVSEVLYFVELKLMIQWIP